MILVRVKVSIGIEPFSPMGIDSADSSQPPSGEICMDKSQLLPAVVPLYLCTSRGGFCTNRGGFCTNRGGFCTNRGGF